MTPQLEAQITLAVYLFIAAIVWVVWTIRADSARKRKQMDRRDFLMDQVSLRIKEWSYFIEELWELKDKKH